MKYPPQGYPDAQAAAARKRYRDEYASGDETEDEAEAAADGYADGEGEPCPNCGRLYRQAGLHACSRLLFLLSMHMTRSMHARHPQAVQQLLHNPLRMQAAMSILMLISKQPHMQPSSTQQTPTQHGSRRMHPVGMAGRCRPAAGCMHACMLIVDS